MAIRFLSRVRPFRVVDDTLGVIYTHGIAGLAGGLMLAFLADPGIIEYFSVPAGHALPGVSSVLYGGSWTLFRWQLEAGAWVIGYTSVVTFIILKVIGIFVPLRATDEELEIGDQAIHGHEVYPSDVPALGGPSAPGWIPVPAGAQAMTASDPTAPPGGLQTTSATDLPGTGSGPATAGAT
jgi:Amt family ammonium transporter